MKIYLLPLLILSASIANAAPVRVAVTPEGEMQRGGKPYFIKGAGGESHLDELARRGGNSVRTWSTDGLLPLLDQCEKLGLTVAAGIWLESECAWFSYGNPEHCQKQMERAREQIRAFRDHPALLTWGLGNESDGDGSNDAYWQQLEALAKMVKNEDPHHPTFTAVAGVTKQRAEGLNTHTPSLDFLGINTYGALPGLLAHAAECGWKRPFAVTEFGARGFWEIAKTDWGAPIEELPGVKAGFVLKAYEKTIAPGKPCLGGYAFVWGHKEEATSTWFGLLTESGETTPLVDALQKAWTGREPENVAPDLKALTSEVKGKSVKPGAGIEARAEAADADGDVLTFHWRLLSEQDGRRDERGKPFPIHEWPECVVAGDSAEGKFNAPDKAGTYRIYVRVSDGCGHAAEGNVVFRVVP